MRCRIKVNLPGLVTFTFSDLTFISILLYISFAFCFYLCFYLDFLSSLVPLITCLPNLNLIRFLSLLVPMITCLPNLNLIRWWEFILMWLGVCWWGNVAMLLGCWVVGWGVAGCVVGMLLTCCWGAVGMLWGCCWGGC